MNVRKMASLVAFGLVLIAGGTEAQQLDEIRAKQERIVGTYADLNAMRFFSERFEKVRALSEECDQLTESLSEVSKGLPVLSAQVQFANPDEALTAFRETMDATVLDSAIRRRILHIEEQLQAKQTTLRNIESQLSLTKGQLLYLYPPQPELSNHPQYPDRLFASYQSLTLKYGDKLRNGVRYCAGRTFDLRSQMNERRDDLNKRLSQLAATYSSTVKNDVQRRLQEASGSSTALQAALDTRSALIKLDARIDQAVLIDSDYYRAKDLLEAYEDMGSLLIASAIPKLQEPEARRSAQQDVEIRLEKARNRLSLLKKHKPSEWLKTRLGKIQKRITERKLSCNPNCGAELKNAEQLIAAQMLVEDVSTDEVYGVLANHILDSVSLMP